MKKRVSFLMGLLFFLCLFLAAAGENYVKAASLPSSIGAPSNITVDHRYDGKSAIKVIYSTDSEIAALKNQEGNVAYLQVDWKFNKDDSWKYNSAWDRGEYSNQELCPDYETIEGDLNTDGNSSEYVLFGFENAEDYWYTHDCGWSTVVPSKYLIQIELPQETVTSIDWNAIGVDVRARYFVRHEEYNDAEGQYNYTYLTSDWSKTVSFGDFSADYADVDNLLVNPDFEQGLKGWKNPDKCWSVVANSDVENARHGRFLTWPVTGSGAIENKCIGEGTRIYQDVDISNYKTDETVVFKTFICNYDQPPHDMGKVVLTFLDKDGNAVVNKNGKKETYTQSQRNPNWNTQTIICSIPEGAATVRVSLYACRYVGSDIDAYYDFCSLVVKPEKVYPVIVTEKNNKSKVKEGDVIQLYAYNSKSKKASDYVWSSSYNTAATVDENGLVTFHTDAEDGMAIYATDKNSGVTGVYWFNSDEENAKYTEDEGSTGSGSGKTDAGNTGSTGSDSGKTDAGNTGSTGSDSGKTDAGSTGSTGTGSGKTDAGDTGSTGTGSGKTDAGDTGSTGSGTTSAKAPKAAKISKLTAASKAITVKWKKVSGVKGYEIRYSTKKSMSSYKAKTISKASTVKDVLLNLKGGKKYYVQIRTYKVVDGKKIYSEWSALKSVKTRK